MESHMLSSVFKYKEQTFPLNSSKSIKLWQRGGPASGCTWTCGCAMFPVMSKTTDWPSHWNTGLKVMFLSSRIHLNCQRHENICLGNGRRVNVWGFFYSLFQQLLLQSPFSILATNTLIFPPWYIHRVCLNRFHTWQKFLLDNPDVLRTLT